MVVYTPIEGSSANDYDYTNADPINNTDLNGHEPRRLPCTGYSCDSWVIPPGVSRCPCNWLSRNPGEAALIAASFIPGANVPTWVMRGARIAGPIIKNGNNILRIGAGATGNFRVSIGPAYKHYSKMSKTKKAFSPVHVHVDRKYGGVDFNWFRRTNEAGKEVPRNWQWWGAK